MYWFLIKNLNYKLQIESILKFIYLSCVYQQIFTETGARKTALMQVPGQWRKYMWRKVPHKGLLQGPMRVTWLTCQSSIPIILIQSHLIS
jgi:hypothetical protein